MKKINIRESLLQFDKDTSCQYDLTSLYEACNLNDEDKKKLVQYIDAKDIDATNRFLTNKATEHGFMESVSDDVSDDELASFGVEKETLTEDTDADTIEQKIKDKTFDVLLKKYDEEFVHDYCQVKMGEVEGCIQIRVNAEVSYSDLEDLGTELTKVITEFDPRAYFEPECPGRLVAYVRKDQSEDIVDEETFKLWTDKFNAVNSRDELFDVYGELVKIRDEINSGTLTAIYELVTDKINEFPELAESLNEDNDIESNQLLEDGTYVYDGGEVPYEICSKIKKIIIKPGVTTIGRYAFSKCYSLTNIVIPDSVTEIGNGAFFECTRLESVKLGNSVATIGKEAFHRCYALNSIKIPDSVTNIGEYAFESCDSLQNVVIGKNIKEIKLRTFGYCSELKNIIIPNNVVEIDGGAFENCYKLSSVTIPNSVTYIAKDAFGVDILHKLIDGYVNLTIKCNKNSYAYEYAQENNIPVALLNESLTEATGYEWDGTPVQVKDWAKDYVLVKNWTIYDVLDSGLLSEDDLLEGGLITQEQYDAYNNEDYDAIPDDITIKKGTHLNYEGITSYGGHTFAQFSLPEYNDIVISISFDGWRWELAELVSAPMSDEEKAKRAASKEQNRKNKELGLDKNGNPIMYQIGLWDDKMGAREIKNGKYFATFVSGSHLWFAFKTVEDAKECIKRYNERQGKVIWQESQIKKMQSNIVGKYNWVEVETDCGKAYVTDLLVKKNSKTDSDKQMTNLRRKITRLNNKIYENVDKEIRDKYFPVNYKELLYEAFSNTIWAPPRDRLDMFKRYGVYSYYPYKLEIDLHELVRAGNENTIPGQMEVDVVNNVLDGDWEINKERTWRGQIGLISNQILNEYKNRVNELSKESGLNELRSQLDHLENSSTNESLTEDAPEKYIKLDLEEPEYNYFTVGGVEVAYKSHEEAKANMKNDYSMENFVEEIRNYLQENDIYSEVYVESDGKLAVHISDGDWKHEHLYTDRMVSKFFFNKGLLVDTETQVTEQDGSDCYSATHYYELSDLIFSMEIKESLEKIATNSKGDYLVASDNGKGFTAFNKNDVCIGGIDGDDQESAINRFKKGDLDESIKITPDSKMKEIDIEDKSETGDVGHPIKQGLKDPTNKPINEDVNIRTVGIYGDEVRGMESVEDIVKYLKGRGLTVSDVEGDMDYGWEMNVTGTPSKLYTAIVYTFNGYNSETVEDFINEYAIDDLDESVDKSTTKSLYMCNNCHYEVEMNDEDYDGCCPNCHEHHGDFEKVEEGIVKDVMNVAKAVGKEVKNSNTYKTHVQSKIDKVKNSDSFKNISKAVKDTDTYKQVKKGVDTAKDYVKNNIQDSDRKADGLAFEVRGKDYKATDLKYTLHGKPLTADEVAQMNAFQRRKVKMTVPKGVKPLPEGVASATHMNWDDDDDFTYDADVWEDEMGVESNKDFFAEGSDYTWMERVSSIETIDFDNWAVWSALNQDTGETEYFVVDEDTEFIDWGPVDTEQEAKEFLQSKVGDYNLDESLDEAWVMSLSDATKNLNDADKNGFYKVMDNITCDPSKCPLDQLENEVGEIAARYTDGNASPEYEGEDFADEEYSGSKIYNAILRLYGRDKEITESVVNEDVEESYDAKTGYNKLLKDVEKLRKAFPDFTFNLKPHEGTEFDWSQDLVEVDITCDDIFNYLTGDGLFDGTIAVVECTDGDHNFDVYTQIEGIEQIVGN